MYRTRQVCLSVLSVTVTSLSFCGSAVASFRFPEDPAITAAELQASAAMQTAWIFGAAIVLAGIAVGVGLFFGLRGQRRASDRDSSARKPPST